MVCILFPVYTGLIQPLPLSPPLISSLWPLSVDLLLMVTARLHHSFLPHGHWQWPIVLVGYGPLHMHGRTVPNCWDIIPGMLEAILSFGVRLISSIVIDHLAITIPKEEYLRGNSSPSSVICFSVIMCDKSGRKKKWREHYTRFLKSPKILFLRFWISGGSTFLRYEVEELL